MQKRIFFKLGKAHIRCLLQSFLVISVVGVSKSTSAQGKVSRKDLMVADMLQRVTSVDIKEISMPAGEKAPYHKHPCSVVGYVVSGSLLFQIEGEAVKLLKQGEAFFEPAEKPIIHFDNASKTKPLKFIAYYLVGDNKQLTELLPHKQ